MAQSRTLTPLTPADLGIGRLFSEIRDAVVVGDATTGRIELWNPAAERLFGYTAEEAIGQPIEMLMPEAVRERHRAGLAHYRATGHGQLVDGGVPVEVPAARKDGRDITIELTLTPIRGGVDEQRFVLAMIRDVTERRRTRDDLARQAPLLDLAHDAVLVRELATSRVLYWSRGAERLYGWT